MIMLTVTDSLWFVLEQAELFVPTGLHCAISSCSSQHEKKWLRVANFGAGRPTSLLTPAVSPEKAVLPGDAVRPSTHRAFPNLGKAGMGYAVTNIRY